MFRLLGFSNAPAGGILEKPQAKVTYATFHLAISSSLHPRKHAIQSCWKCTFI